MTATKVIKVIKKVLVITAAVLLLACLAFFVWVKAAITEHLVYEGPDGQKIIIVEQDALLSIRATIYLKDGFFSFKEEIAKFSHDPPLGATYDVTWSEDAVTVAFCDETVVTHPLD